MEPALMVTEAGIELTAALPLVTVKFTVISAAAVAARVTVPVLLPPAITEVGENFRELGVLAVAVKEAVLAPPFAAAETWTIVFVETLAVTREKVAVELPASTFTEAGIELTAAPPLVTVRVTGMLDVAGAARVTVPVLLPPAMTEVGKNFREFGVLGFTVKVLLTAEPLRLADTLTVVDALTLFVTTGKVATDAPDGTVTQPGIEATAELPLTTLRTIAVSETVGAPRVTVPVVLNPPTSDVGLNFKELGTSGVRVRTALRFEPLKEPASVAVVLLATAVVVTVTVALVAPVGMVTLGGSTASELLLERFVTAPPTGATPTR